MSTKYTKELLQEAANNSTSVAGVLRHLGLKQSGGTQSHISSRMKYFGVDMSHFTYQAWNKGQPAPTRKTSEQILVVLPDGSHRPKVHQLRRAMFELGVAHRCVGINCPNPEPMWAGKPLTLEIDHIDGNWLNNLLENLRFLCPNCHSQEYSTNRGWKNS